MRAARSVEHKMLCPGNPPAAHKYCTGYEDYEAGVGNQRGCSSLRRCQTIALWRVSERAKSAATAIRCHMIDFPARKARRRSLALFAALGLYVSIASAQLPNDVPSLAPMIERV